MDRYFSGNNRYGPLQNTGYGPTDLERVSMEKSCIITTCQTSKTEQKQSCFTSMRQLKSIRKDRLLKLQAIKNMVSVAIDHQEKSYAQTQQLINSVSGSDQQIETKDKASEDILPDVARIFESTCSEEKYAKVNPIDETKI